MISLKFRTYSGLFGIGFLVCIVAVSILAFGPPPVALSASVSDKVLHVAAFFVLSFLLDGAFSKSPFGLKKVLVLLSYGMLIEVVQWQLPGRDFSLLDFLADGGGIVMYWVCHKPIWFVADLFITHKT